MPAPSRAQVGILATARSKALVVAGLEDMGRSFESFSLVSMFKLALSQVPQELLIGDVARRAGVRPSAIRYYESIGLLPEPERVAGRRRYPAEILRTLSVIDSGQRAGLSLDEVRELLTVADGAAAVSERLRAIAQRKLPEVDALIERPRLVRSWLEAPPDWRCPTLADCPLFDDPNLPAAASIH